MILSLHTIGGISIFTQMIKISGTETRSLFGTLWRGWISLAAHIS